MNDIQTMRRGDGDLGTDKMIGRKDGAIGWLIFNNPERRNAFSIEMTAAIPEIIDAFEADPEIRVVVVRGAGDKAFIAGADISQFEKQRASADGIAKFDAVAKEANARLKFCSKPTLAMINGYCMGGGVGWALNCDLRIAADDARFGVPAARLGLGYKWDGLRNLMDVVGPANAKEIFYTARQFNSHEAWHMGLINRSLPADEVEGYVRDYCARIAENAPLTILAVKRCVGELLKPLAKRDEALMDEVVQDCFDSEDYKEGRRAFMEKRKPVFQGR